MPVAIAHPSWAGPADNSACRIDDDDVDIDAAGERRLGDAARLRRDRVGERRPGRLCQGQHGAGARRRSRLGDDALASAEPRQLIGEPPRVDAAAPGMKVQMAGRQLRQLAEPRRPMSAAPPGAGADI